MYNTVVAIRTFLLSQFWITIGFDGVFSKSCQQTLKPSLLLPHTKFHLQTSKSNGHTAILVETLLSVKWLREVTFNIFGALATTALWYSQVNKNFDCMSRTTLYNNEITIVYEHF